MYPVQKSREQRWDDKAEQDEENLQREERASVNSCRETGEHSLSSTLVRETDERPPRLWSVHRFVALWIHLKGDGPRSDFNKPGNSNRRVSLTQNGFLKRPNYNIAEQ